jgi:F-type H+-transporting ATPase subunit delta
VLTRSRAAKRYAKALFDLARQTGETDSIRRDIDKLQELMNSMPDLSSFMRNYMLPRATRTITIDEIFSGMVNLLTFQFISLLEEKKRCGILAQVCVAFVDLHDRMLGMVKGRITTPVQLEKSDIEAVTSYARTKTEGQLLLSTVVDPSLLGGFKLRLGDVVYDASVSAQLHMLKEKMISV